MPANFPPTDEAIESAIDSVIQAADQEFIDDESLTHAGLPTAEADDSERSDRDGLGVVSNASIFTDVRHCHPDPIRAAERLDDLHFAMLGLRTNESRLLTIRRAAQRSAGALASVQIVTPSTVNECHLARVVTAAYRVMDPRLRIDRHQQVQLGRILAHSLESVSCSGFASQSTARTATSTQLAELAILASERADVDEDIWVRPAGPPLSFDPPTTASEREEVFAEIRGGQGRLKRWLADARTLIGLVVLSLIATFYLAWWMGARQADQSSIRIVLDKHESIPTYPKFTELTDDSNETDVSELDANESFTSVADSTDEPMWNESMGSSEIGAVDPSFHEVPNPESELIVAVDPPDAVGSPDAMLSVASDFVPELETFANPEPDAVVASGVEMNSSPLSLDWSEIDPASVDAIATTLPKASETVTRFTDAEIEAAAEEQWDQTEGVIRRFGLAGAFELIDQWELTGELAGPASLEQLATSRLCLRASWFGESLRQTIDRAERHSVAVGRDGDQGTSARSKQTVWSDEMVRQLVQSWRNARSNVSDTQDLNHLLVRGIGLLDQLVLHEQFSWCSSFGLEVERLAGFTTEADLRQELVEMLASIKMLPDKVELDRMRTSEASRGLWGRILCLQFRRWDEGLPLLCDASDSRLSSLASLEIQWRDDSFDKTVDAAIRDQTLGELAVRWSRIANRFTGREAAAIRLHAAELMDGLDGFESERDEIQGLLPSYLSVSTERPVAQSHGGKSLRLSRLK